jgi:hypothetical protein
VAGRRILSVKVRPDYEPFFAILDRLLKDGDLRYWIEPLEVQADTRDIEACTGQMSAGVKTFSQMSDKTSTCLANAMTSAQEYKQ